jgi:hypothetical protein
MKKIGILLMACAIACLAGCSDNPVDKKDPDPFVCCSPTADSIAQYWFGAIADTLGGLGDKNQEGIRETDLSAIRGGFEEALAIESGNSIAHLGLSILEIIEINYNQDVWEVIDSLNAWGGGMGSRVNGRTQQDRSRSLIGRPFSLLVEIPFSFSMASARSLPPNVTVGRIQDIIAQTIMPAVTRAIDHLAIVEQNTKAKLTLEVGGNGAAEIVIIDLGEIYFFDATLHALRAGFGIATAYDCDFFGPDDTYGWIDDVMHLEGGENCADYAIIDGPSGDTLDIAYPSYSSAETDSILIAVAHYNFAHRDSFLTLRNGGAVMNGAKLDLAASIGKLEGSVNFIKNVRENETEQNIIKLTGLSELESNIGDPAGPNFAKEFQSIEDILNWVRELMSGPMQFSEELGPRNETFTWTMDLGALLTDPVDDWKSLLPYHRWTLPAGPWIERSRSLNWEWAPYIGQYWGYVHIGGICQFQEFTGLAWVRRYYCIKEINTSGLELLDGPNGSPIDLGIERMFYFPDYTFHGVFPGMTHARWLELVTTLE